MKTKMFNIVCAVMVVFALSLAVAAIELNAKKYLTENLRVTNLEIQETQMPQEFEEIGYSTQPKVLIMSVNNNKVSVMLSDLEGYAVGGVYSLDDDLTYVKELIERADEIYFEDVEHQEQITKEIALQKISN